MKISATAAAALLAPWCSRPSWNSAGSTPIDPDRWPAIGLARRAIEAGDGAGAVLNAANEAAVEAFLDPRAPRIAFGAITTLVAEAMDEIGAPPLRSLADAIDAGTQARRFVESRLGAMA